MDTTTVLEIIKMISNTECKENECLQPDYYRGAQDTLLNLQDYLQGFIEAELNAEENKSTEQ